jgi:hypothetical protein
LFARYLVASGAPVVAIDADINQHLAVALGLTEDEAAALPALGARPTPPSMPACMPLSQVPRPRRIIIPAELPVAIRPPPTITAERKSGR